MAKRGATLEDKYIGKEPLYTGEEQFTASEYQKACNYYNYFYKNKDYLPNIYRFAEDVMGYNKKKVAVLRKVKDWKFLSSQKIIQLYYRGWKFDEASLQRAKDTITSCYKEGLQIKAEVAEKKKNIVVISTIIGFILSVLICIMIEFISVFNARRSSHS